MFFKQNLLICLLVGVSLVSTGWNGVEAKRPTTIPPNCPPKCNNAYRCSPYYSVELLWTLVDGICRVWANGCVEGSEQCHRQNDCKPPMIDTTEEECLPFCAVCSNSQPQNTVCGWFPHLSPTGTPGEDYIEFPNQCELDKWSCENGRPYGSVTSGPCT